MERFPKNGLERGMAFCDFFFFTWKQKVSPKMVLKEVWPFKMFVFCLLVFCFLLGDIGRCTKSGLER